MSSVQLPELRELNPQSQQWWGLKFLFFFKKNSNSCNFTNQDIGKQTAPFSPCPVPSTDPADNAPSPNPSTPFEVYPTVLLQPAHLTTSTFNKLNIEPCQLKKEQYIHCIYSHFYTTVINILSVIWWTFSPFDTLTFTNLYRPLSLHLNVNSKICVIRCSI